MRLVAAGALPFLLAAAGCGSDDCVGQPVPPCPSSAAVGCVAGKLECVPLDLSSAVHDMSPRSSDDLAAHGD